MPKYYVTEATKPVNPFFDACYSDENVAVAVAMAVAEREGHDFFVYRVEPIYCSEVGTSEDE